MRAFSSQQCGLGSIPSIDAICGLSLLLVLSFALKGFSPGTLVFSSPQKNIFKFQVHQKSGRLCGCATSKSWFVFYLNVYLFKCLFIYHQHLNQKVESPHQGCALAMPGDLWCLTFVPGWLQSFFVEIIMLGTLDFNSLEHWAPFSTALPHLLLVYWTTPAWSIKGQCFWKENCHCYVLFAGKTISLP